MAKKQVMKLLYPLLLLVLLLADGQISNALRAATNNTLFLSSHFLLIGMIIGSLSYPKKYMVWVALFMGAVFDMYYYGILGINMVSLPLTVLLIYTVFEYVKPSLLTILFSLIVFITIMDGSAFLLQIIFNIIHMNILEFIVRYLGPSLLMNIVIYIVLAFPLKKMLKL